MEKDLNKKKLTHPSFFYLSKRWLIFLIIIFFIFVSTFIFIGEIFIINIFLFFILPLILIIAFIENWKLNINKKMQHFAKNKDLSYQKEGRLDSLRGRIFNNISYSKKAKNIIRGSFKGFPVKFFNYQERGYSFTILEIKIKGIKFPHILLHAKKYRPLGAYPWRRLKNDVKYSLDEEFRQFFDLYYSRGYGIEVTQIFKPEILSFIISKSDRMSVEFVGNKIYIYDNRFISKEGEIKEMYQVAEIIFSNMEPLVKRVKKDFEALYPYFKK